MSSKDKIINKAKTAKRESKYIEFKESFDVTSKAEWCEMIKDIVAIANSGGGIILIGIDDNGHKSVTNLKPILQYDYAQITDKLYKYTGTQFSDYEVVKLKRRNYITAAIVIGASYPPMIFTSPGTYPKPDGQGRAFSKGTMYFRHGAKSEPAVSADLEIVIEREIKRRKKGWLGNIRRLIGAPSDYQMHLLPSNIKVSTEKTATPVRITTDESAKALKLSNPDEIFKYRRTEIVDIINKKLKGKYSINPYDIQTVCYTHHIYDNENFVYQPTYSSPQYSDAFVDHIVKEYKKDEQYFDKARNEYYDRRLKK